MSVEVADIEGETASLSARRNRYVATACEACKTAKKKCDGNQPCQNCVDHNRQCVVDETRDRRRGRKRTWDEMHIKASALDTILDSLRSSDDASVQSLLQMIRNDASIDEIRKHATQLLQQNLPRHKSQDRNRRDVMAISTLTDNPPIRVPAKPWTDVTDDDDFVSHLISIYFVWHWPDYPTVDRETFLAAMRSMDVSSKRCSPLLVSAILAVACSYSDHASVFANPNDHYSRGQHFLEEAKKRWNDEEGKVSLTNLQAISPLIFGNIIAGKDQISLHYLLQSTSLRTELERRARLGQRRGVNDYASIDYRKSHNLAVWATFACAVETAIAYLRPISIPIPQTAKPWNLHDLEAMALWSPYPKAGPQISYAPIGTLEERINLYIIACHIPPLLSTMAAGGRSMSPPDESTLGTSNNLSRLRSVQLQLLEWYNDLPIYARQGPDSLSSIAPAVIDTLLAYHTYQITVQEAIVVEEDKADEMEQDEEYHDQSRDETKPLHISRDAEDEIIFASTNIADMLRNYEHAIGFTHFPTYAFQACMKSASALLNMLQRTGVVDLFHSLIVVLLATSRRWTLAHGALKAMWVTINERELNSLLRERTKELFNLGVVEDWGPDDHLQFARCSYPNYAAADKGRQELEELGEFLEKASRWKIDF